MELLLLHNCGYVHAATYPIYAYGQIIYYS